MLIEIIDDGKGIDPAFIKRKACEKDLIDEATMERISDHDAVNLVFAAGFSTVDVVSDLSGRGVGMDAAGKSISMCPFSTIFSFRQTIFAVGRGRGRQQSRRAGSVEFFCFFGGRD